LPAILAVVVTASLCVGAYAGYRWLTHSERFAIAILEIRGNTHLEDEQIRSLLGVAEGDNIFGFSLSRLERKLERDPWIATASMRRRLPDHLIVEIGEETPAALVDLDGLYLTEAGGRVFKRASLPLGEGLGLPVITGLAREDYLRDQAATAARIRAALAVASAYSADPERPALGEIHLDARRGTTLLTYENAVAIRVGHSTGETLAERLRVFDAAWASLTPQEREDARVVHVDNTIRPDRVTVGYGETRAN
jgi:cell division protein FtsQ